jgi:hypothetical protein
VHVITDPKELLRHRGVIMPEGFKFRAEINAAGELKIVAYGERKRWTCYGTALHLIHHEQFKELPDLEILAWPEED